jgi:hypothetical protein
MNAVRLQALHTKDFAVRRDVASRKVQCERLDDVTETEEDVEAGLLTSRLQLASWDMTWDSPGGQAAHRSPPHFCTRG